MLRKAVNRMTDVKGKWAFITGASRGIGYLTALFMASKGCNLILHARKKEILERLSKKVEIFGVRTYLIEAELSDPDAVEAMLAEIDDTGLQVDFVLNNAGIQVAHSTEWFETPSEDYDLSFRVNTIAPIMICYHFMPKMIKHGFGRIVNTSSGISKEPQQGPYSASKAALDKATKDLATIVEGTEVMINLADPGWCRTDMGGSNAPNSPESVIPGICAGVFLDDRKSGRWLSAQDYCGLTIEEAVEKAMRLT
ncbi:short-subunit dehydrogenase [Ruminiclostridium sufflavum DSM 19573]|uniref:Short-subunit dehydrogenase n=1 Tax=Ruminiclostridium sufflavum DSM 19573 TaxID=1121337 RepID=A0A318XK46_9FIRM|nr:SDR family oxidoreductase [Ruminiclostridium sufflavum]PYG87655.1 short-subunit dehydrogenase [Ruminiclostridium sufflavum DSM 19573]